MMRSVFVVPFVVALFAILIAALLVSGRSRANDPDVISRNGIHWHPSLEIFVGGEPVSIPADIGIGGAYAGMPTFDAQMSMTAVHTHEDMPVIHLEFPGVVRSSDITLGTFMRIWGKDIRSFGANLRMTVNGIENTEHENYIMKDGDTIQLHYD